MPREVGAFIPSFRKNMEAKVLRYSGLYKVIFLLLHALNTSVFPDLVDLDEGHQKNIITIDSSLT